MLPGIGFDLATLDVEGIKGRGFARSAAALAKIPRSLLQSRRIIGRFAPDIVIGVGGYASGPAVLAARFMGLPTAIAEQNAIPGETNRVLGKFADRIFVSFPRRRGGFAPTGSGSRETRSGPPSPGERVGAGSRASRLRSSSSAGARARTGSTWRFWRRCRTWRT